MAIITIERLTLVTIESESPEIEEQLSHIDDLEYHLDTNEQMFLENWAMAVDSKEALSVAKSADYAEEYLTYKANIEQDKLDKLRLNASFRANCWKSVKRWLF